jgi:hypothetical protein
MKSPTSRRVHDIVELRDQSCASDTENGLAAGTMACDGAWPAERIAALRGWIDAGKPA